MQQKGRIQAIICPIYELHGRLYTLIL